LLPVLPHGSGVDLGINIAFDDEAEHTELFVGAKQWIFLERLRKLLGDCWKRLLVAFDVGPDSAKLCIQRIPVVTGGDKESFRFCERWRRVGPIVEIG
jgi:hypothetical protein